MTKPALLRLVDRRPVLFHGVAPSGELPPGWLDIAHQLLKDIESVLGTDALSQFRVVSISSESGMLADLNSFAGNPAQDDRIHALRTTAERL